MKKKKKFPLKDGNQDCIYASKFHEDDKTKGINQNKKIYPCSSFAHHPMISEYDWDVACGGLFLGLIPYCQPLPKQLDFQIC